MLLWLPAILHAQNALEFNKRFIQVEDKWVAFTQSEDSTYMYGFIYIDAQAGLTFNHEGHFRMEGDKIFGMEKLEDTSFKVRLRPNNVRVAVIPESMFGVLQIDTIPHWLKHYKTDVDSVYRMYDWGFMYNGWGECQKALEFLEPAREKDRHYPGLAVELAFSYNCLKQFDKALEVLGDALAADPTNAYVNKEYIYTLIHLKQIDKAIDQFRGSVKSGIETTFNAENCFNILGHFYYAKDRENFKIWLKELKKWPTEDKRITQNAKLMKAEMK